MARKKPVMKRYFPNPPPESEPLASTSASASSAAPQHQDPTSAEWETVGPRRVTNAAPQHQDPTSAEWETVGPRRVTNAAIQAPHPAPRAARHTPQAASSGQMPNVDAEVNASIPERFTNLKIDTTQKLPPVQEMTQDIRHYVAQERLPVNTDSWLSRAEIPTSEEIMDTEDAHVPALIEGTVPIPQNKTKGPWTSKEEYLETHYELLREDTILPLREAVGRIRNKPWAREQEYGSTVGVYNNVRIVGFTFANRGVAARIQFSLARAGKRIHWEQSKRLLTGSLLALSPEEDGFRTRCTMAIVAARPLATLVQDPPEIDIYFACPEQLEVDPGKSWIMVEERSSFFEATRHTLRSLQKLMRESFPLSEHIINVQQTVDAPAYVASNPYIDLSSIFGGTEAENVDILADWPEDPKTDLDKTQLRALHRMLSKKCAIIQGPPGTGKTHVSVVALKALLKNMSPGVDPPIIVACQTNHALDQLLRHVAEPDFARLGGRSRDPEIKLRTVYELKQGERLPPIVGGLMRPSIFRMRNLEKDMRAVLSPLQIDASFIPHSLLRKLGVITQEQFESFERGDTLWISHGKEQAGPNREDRIQEWLGNNFERAERGIPPDDFAFEYEEVDLEFEQLKEIEAENMTKDDEDFETLRGQSIYISDNFIGKESQSTNLTDDDIQLLLAKTTDVYRIKDRQRGAVFNYLMRQAKENIRTAFRVYAKNYDDAARLRTAGRWEEDYLILKRQKLIGMTTTGFSKYRALVSSLKPKIVLIEEAAETLEAPVTASCVPSLEHLILVGDHQQLRPHCNVMAHENEPFNLNMSLFERLVKNEVEYDTLRRQRRMIPEIRRLIKPIYGDLIKDHPSVKDPLVRPPVPGMGVNTFFFTHEWPESVDVQMSSCNTMEAEMIVQFYNYLYMNGTSFSSITVLTFYNGQRKLLLKKLRTHPNLQGTGRDFRVVTVDSYQGEENDIVLLSLVRSNPEGKIGFLNNDNRVCVALSRAKRGFYMFGNGQILATESKTWSDVVTILHGRNARRIGFYLPLTCVAHERKTFIGELDDWALVNGGCEMKCEGRLPCGHFCLLRCHSFPHEHVSCMQKCRKVMACGHVCAGVCGDDCRCTICVRGSGAILRPGAKPTVAGPPTIQPTGVPSQSARQAGSISIPPPQTTCRESGSSGSDPVMWKSYTQNVRQHDLEATRRANQHYEVQQKEFDQQRISALEEDMERSIFVESYRSTPSPAAGTTLDGHAPRRKKMVENFIPGPKAPVSKKSILDLD